MKVDSILPYLFDEDWFNNLDQSSVWVRIYSVIGIPWEEAEKAFQPAINKTSLDIPIKILHGKISNLDVGFSRVHIVSHPNGSPLFHAELGKRKIPESLYVIFSSPFKIDGQEGNQADIKSSMDKIAAVMRLYVGSNFLREILFEEIVHVGSGNKRGSSNVIAMPSQVEGPYLTDEIWRNIQDTIDEINKLSDLDKKRRIGLALELFERGSNFNEKNKFFYFWVAIEILCDSHYSTVIKRKLSKYYGKSIGYIQNKLMIEKIINLRTALIHKGSIPIVNARFERYIQMIFLDFLRDELNLPCEYLAKHFFETKGITEDDIINTEYNVLQVYIDDVEPYLRPND